LDVVILSMLGSTRICSFIIGRAYVYNNIRLVI
jgi:hypothetical protein